MISLIDYIQIYPEVLTEKFCTLICNEYQDSEFFVATTTSPYTSQNRNCLGLKIDHDEIVKKNFSIRSKIIKNLENCLIKIIQKNVSNHYPFLTSDISCSGFDLLKYNTGGFYTTHTDSCKEFNRYLSVIFILNDEYEGGDLCFFENTNYEYRIQKQKKGTIIMFPANFLFPHCVTNINKGTRFSIVSWII